MARLVQRARVARQHLQIKQIDLQLQVSRLQSQIGTPINQGSYCAANPPCTMGSNDKKHASK